MLQQDLGILLATQIFAQNITNFIVPYILLIVKADGGQFRKGRERRRARERDVDAGVEYLSECDEQLDNIKATTMEATQYGYVTLFSAAFPPRRS